jgi:hypothetical protein
MYATQNSAYFLYPKSAFIDFLTNSVPNRKICDVTQISPRSAVRRDLQLKKYKENCQHSVVFVHLLALCKTEFTT